MKAHHWFLIIAIVVILWVLLRGGEERFAAPPSARIDYDRLAVSQGITAGAAALNLQENLDVSLLPDLGRKVIRDAAQQGLREQRFLEFVLREVSNRVREISTIDLNGDDIVDPILVKPEPKEGEYVLLSIRVPAAQAYPLPSESDTAAWKKVETLEVATMTVTLDKEQLTVQARGNQHVYPNQAGNHYVSHDRSPNFLQMYFAMRMTQMMFYPRFYGFYGAGFGYGGYRPVGVPVARTRRAGAIGSRGYSSASATRSSAIRTRTGGTPTSQYGRQFSKQPPRSLSQLRSSASFQRRQAANVRSGGFGRGGRSAGTVTRSARGGGFSRGGFSTSRRITGGSGFGRGFSRGSFGGGGGRFGK